MSEVTSQQYNEAMNTIEVMKAENSLLRSNLHKAIRRGDLLQADLDSIDDFYATCESEVARSLSRKVS